MNGSIIPKGSIKLHSKREEKEDDSADAGRICEVKISKCLWSEDNSDNDELKCLFPNETTHVWVYTFDFIKKVGNIYSIVLVNKLFK